MGAEQLMSSRLNLAEASVLPFQFPPLKGGEAAKPNVAVPALDVPSPDGIDAPAAVASEENGPEGGVADSENVAAAISAERAQARAEGLQCGLEEGREQGYAAGFAEGKRAGETSLVEEMRRLEAIVAELGRPLTALEQPVEEAIVALALEVARCVVGDEVRRSHEFLARLVREAIAKVPLEMGVPRVLLNPADLELIRKLVPEIEPASATLLADETIDAGGCLVIADGEGQPLRDRRWNPRAADGVSQVDLTLSARWRAVMLALFDGEGG
jgi:flagellar assembly protein FliH